jgi:hypothetical protein
LGILPIALLARLMPDGIYQRLNIDFPEGRKILPGRFPAREENTGQKLPGAA